MSENMPDPDVAAAAPQEESSSATPRACEAGIAGLPELILVAASADGLLAIRTLLSGLPRDFPVPLAVVLHRRRSSAHLENVLGRACALRVKQADDGEQLCRGIVYLAPADRHLVIQPDRTFHLMDGRKIKYLLSAANPLFESAAAALGGQVVAVVLTGSGSDATDGVQAIKRSGGTVIVQDPATAAFASMPRNAITSGAVDHVLALDQIPPFLGRLVTS